MLLWLAGLSAAERATLALTATWTALCTGPGHRWLVHLVHPLALAVVSVWAALLAVEVVRALAAGRALDRISVEATVAGVRCRLLPGGGGAFAMGGLRPRIYVPKATLERLTPGEIDAVMLHEEYHRRSSAPLRSAAIRVWIRMCGWIPFTRTSAEKRLADLEIRADRWAIARGVETAAIAGALLKDSCGGSGTVASAYADGGNARVRWLTTASAGRPGRLASLPMELAPVVLALLPLVTCHLSGALA